MENKQTAVDWLVNKIYMVIPNEERNFLEGLREQAKQMEKEQIMNAFLEGKVNHSKDWAIEYYNQTFNQNK